MLGFVGPEKPHRAGRLKPKHRARAGGWLGAGAAAAGRGDEADGEVVGRRSFAGVGRAQRWRPAEGHSAHQQRVQVGRALSREVQVLLRRAHSVAQAAKARPTTVAAAGSGTSTP